MRFLNASVLERKSLNRNLSRGFPLGNLLPKTRVLKHRILERKREPKAKASALGTLRFRTLSLSPRPFARKTSPPDGVRTQTFCLCAQRQHAPPHPMPASHPNPLQPFCRAFSFCSAQLLWVSLKDIRILSSQLIPCALAKGP